MNEPEDLFADDPWESPAAPTRLRTQSAKPNGWKAAALVCGGIAGGALAASAIWCVAFLALMAQHESEMFTANYGDTYGEEIWSEYDTDALTVSLEASPVFTEHVGSVVTIGMNDAQSFSDDAEWDEYYYDVVGDAGSGLVRVRFETQTTFQEADLTLPDGTVLDLGLPGPSFDDFGPPDAFELEEIDDVAEEITEQEEITVQEAEFGETADEATDGDEAG